ncbi:TPA: hypothetical protein QDA95_003885 [Burkholderia vietnamiensis]|nr:hypothetical protein [Burkholderia vietnamiensis]HDR8978786.1 hypothetical protein [Burkholderia vietnamiensis]
MMHWIVEHWEWLFGGVGGTAVVALAGWLFNRGNGSNQTQLGGDKSINVQAGRDSIVKDTSNKNRRG